MTLEQQLTELLKDIPSIWRDKLIQLLCQIKADKSTIDCAQVRECETVTTLSNFEIDGTTVSISYTDEGGVTVTRSFDVDTLLNAQLEGLDQGCLTDETTWSNMSFLEKIQMFVDAHCDCCPTTTTTSTTTTTTV